MHAAVAPEAIQYAMPAYFALADTVSTMLKVVVTVTILAMSRLLLDSTF